jgi:prepilin-type N-terminal cleavage/methylation domain-containing protein
MKNLNQIPGRFPSSRTRGFTLVEMMMVVGIFLFIFVGVMTSVQLFGLRIYTLEATKLVATQGARTALNQMRDGIREAKEVYVGSCTTTNATSFTLLGATNTQVGNAIIIYPTTSTTGYTVFYLDTSSSPYTLMQFNVTNSTVTYAQPLTSYITNLNVFDAENYLGQIPTNYTSLDNREIIKITLQFSQWEYPIAFVGGNTFNAFDYYQLRTRVFRRAWN